MSTTCELVQVADAVAAELNAESFSLPFTAVRHYETAMELEETGEIAVDVVPVSPGMEEESDTTLRFDSAVDVAVRYKFTSADTDPATGRINTLAVDDLLNLVQELGRFLSLRRLTEFDAVFVSIETMFGWVPDHLQQWSQFTSIFRVTYRTSLPAEEAA